MADGTPSDNRFPRPDGTFPRPEAAAPIGTGRVYEGYSSASFSVPASSAAPAQPTFVTPTATPVSTGGAIHGKPIPNGQVLATSNVAPVSAPVSAPLPASKPLSSSKPATKSTSEDDFFSSFGV